MKGPHPGGLSFQLWYQENLPLQGRQTIQELAPSGCEMVEEPQKLAEGAALAVAGSLLSSLP